MQRINCSTKGKIRLKFGNTYKSGAVGKMRKNGGKLTKIRDNMKDRKIYQRRHVNSDHPSLVTRPVSNTHKNA